MTPTRYCTPLRELDTRTCDDLRRDFGHHTERFQELLSERLSEIAALKRRIGDLLIARDSADARVAELKRLLEIERTRNYGS